MISVQSKPTALVLRLTEPLDLLIAGAGSGGLAAALHLVRSDRRWKERMVVVEKGVHPRDKLCGGGVTRTAEEELGRLGLGWLGGEDGGGASGGDLATPAQVPITELRLVFGDRGWAVREEPVFRVVRRRELAHWLLRSAERVLLAGDAAGVDPLPGERISFALAHGRVAAGAVADAFIREDFSFDAYAERLLTDSILAQLARRRRLAEWVYGLRSRWGLAAVWAFLPWLVRGLLRLRPGILPVTTPRLEALSGLAPEELRSGA